MCARACAREEWNEGQGFRHRTTLTVTYRVVTLPVRGTMTTRTLHVPIAVPRTELPTNLHLVVPDVMLMRMVPCDRRGMERPAAAATRAAVNNLVRRTVSVRCTGADGATVVVAPATPASCGAEPPTVVGDTLPGGADAGTVVVVDVVDVVVDELVDVELDVVVVETVIETTVAAAERSVWSFTPS